MYTGYLAFDGVEVVNMERLMAYVDAGIIPVGVSVEDCTGTCEGLGEALGDAPYEHPLMDDPPWFDPHNPDTADFAGLMPLDITGLDGSTRTVPTVDLLTRGVVAGRPHYGGRTIAVSAILLGRTSAGVEAGLAWLTNVLHRTCQPVVPCLGADLRAFTVCPTPICPGGFTGPDSDLVQTNQPYSPDTWLHLYGTVNTAGTQFTTALPSIARNYARNPSAEYGVQLWHNDPVNTGYGGAAVTQATVPDPSPVVPAGTHTARVAFTALAGQPSAQTQQVTGLTVGRWYSYTARLWQPASGGASAAIYVAGQAGVVSEPTTVTGQWVRRTVSWQATATTAEVGVVTANPNTGGNIYVDALLVTALDGSNITRTDFEQAVSPWAPVALGDSTPARLVESTTEQAATGLASMAIRWGYLVRGTWVQTDPALTWDTVDPPDLTWADWPTA